MKYKKITEYSLFTLTVILGPYIYGSIQLYFFDKELYQELSENPIDVLYGQFLFENIINHIIFLILFLALYYFVLNREKPILTKAKKNIFPNPSNKNNHDDVLKKLFKNLKGIDFSKIINNSIDIKKDIVSDVDGSWYAHSSTFPIIIKSFSINNYKASLDDLLQANGIDKASVKKKNKVIEYWEGDGFDIEAPPKSDGYRCIVVVNNKYVHKENLKFQKSKFTNKKHSLDWISGLEIFDGKDALKKSNPLENVNVPLYFKEGEDEFIMIACPVQEAAIGLINKIIELNGGNEGFESDTAKGWESLMNGGKFIIGYRPDDVAIRINKITKDLTRVILEEEKFRAGLRIDYKDGNSIFIDPIWKYRLNEEEQTFCDDYWETLDSEEVDSFFITKHKGKELMVDEDELISLFGADEWPEITYTNGWTTGIDFDDDDDREIRMKKWNNFKSTFNKANSTEQFKIIKD